MVDLKGVTSSAVALVVLVVTIVMGVVLTDNLSNTTGLGTEAQNIAANGTDLLGDLIVVWGPIILLGIVIVSVFVGILLALQFLAKRGGGGR